MLTILIVDDEPLIRHCLLRELRNYACRPLTAGGASEALEVLERERVDVLLTDYRMPGMTGADLVRYARTLRPDISAVVLSATPAEARRDLGDDTPVLHKPWNRLELERAVFPEMLRAA